MSCQEVMSMLSAYIDGEVQTSDADMIKTHLSECDSCAAECKALQSMTGILRTTPEVEPPAFLLAQIEAATVNRTGFLTRIQRAFDQVPVIVRWATAPAAAAIILLGILLSNNGRIESPLAVKSPIEQIEKAIPGMPDLPSITIEERSPKASVVVATRPVTRASQNGRTGRDLAGGAKAPSHATTSRDHGMELATPADNPAPVEPKLEDPVVEEPVMASNPADEPEPNTVAKTAVDEPVALAKAADDKPIRKTVVLDEQPSGMDQLRRRLAAQNKAKLNGREDRIEGKKYSVGLISLKF